MKKKILFILLILFINMCYCNAKEITCNYHTLEDAVDIQYGVSDYTIKYDDEKLKFTEPNTDVTTGQFIFDLYAYGIGKDSLISADEDKEKTLIKKFESKCQKKIYICPVRFASGSGGSGTTAVFDNSILPTTKANVKSTGFLYGSAEIDPRGCKKFEYKDGNENGTIDISYVCTKYDKLLAKVKNRYKKYYEAEKRGTGKYTFQDENGKEVQKTPTLIAKEHSIAIDEIKSYCHSVIANQNSGDVCMTSCLNLASDLEKYLMNKSDSKDKCSLTDNIIVFITNILKWAKYIAPVIVIILSILDFIKAIAAQNDDEMKKAQGKFVKRLIVAALLFLLPLIINFMLKTFGLYNSECDIGNLFSQK